MGSFVKKYWLALVSILIALMCLASLGGCATVEKTESPSANSRFVLVETTALWRIVYDKDTKVMYEVSNGAYNLGNFTLLVDSE